MKTSFLIFLSVFVSAGLHDARAQTTPPANKDFAQKIVEVEAVFNPANPNNAVEDLNNIYNLIRKFRLKNQGNHPAKSTALLQDLIKDPLYYGFQSYSDARFIFLNPDSQYSGTSHPETYIAYPIAIKRPDGLPLESPRTASTRDIWSLTDIYRHNKAIDGINNPSGFYVVLWDDGKVEKVPYDLVISIARDQSLRRPFFPGQAGIPADALSYDESFLRLPINDYVPRGKPLHKGSGKLVIDNGGPEALVALSRSLSMPNRYGIDRNELWEQLDPSQAEFTLQDIQVSTVKLGLSTQIETFNLSDLQRSGSPGLVFLKDDGRIATVIALDDDRAIIVDRGMTRNVKRNVLEARYSGEALIPTKALTQNAGIVADDAVREVNLPSLEAEVPQSVTLRNTGKTPVTLQLEYPLLGVTESKLSQDTLAPGETATLDLKIKWRSILETPTQNVLVSLQTSDPIVPRLQLAFLLVPPTAAK